MFDVVFYDYYNNIVDIVRERVYEIKSNTNRAFKVTSNKIMNEMNEYARSYKITLIRATTTDIEKVILKKEVLTRLESGDMSIRGVVKNVSDFKTDAVVAVSFIDSYGLEVGCRVMQVRDIEPGATREFKHNIFAS
jgi:hypothetical protein